MLILNILVLFECLALALQAHISNKTLSAVEGPNTRIVNGLEATKGQFPWQAVLETKISEGYMVCGGSLITSTWVLTAAHCIQNPIVVTVYLGIVRLDDINRSPIKAGKILPHPNYIGNAQNVVNDIALVGLSKIVAFSEFIQPIKLGTVPVVAGVTVTASGWGKTSDLSSISYQLKYADLVTISNEECYFYYGSFVLSGAQVCARGKSTQSTCQGDSGGPLIYGSGKNTVLVGIISFGFALTCNIGYPTGYTRVAPYVPWIVSNVGVI